MTTRRAAFALAIAGLSGGPVLAATCHMTVQGTPVIDDQECSIAGRGSDVRVDDEVGDTIRIRRSLMSARFGSPRPGERRRRGGFVPYGQIVSSTDSDDKTCWFNQKATLCVDP